MAIANQLLRLQRTHTPTPNFSPSSPSHHPSIASLLISNRTPSSNKPHTISRHRCAPSVKPKASSNSGGIVPADDEDGVSLGTMKLAANTDIARFETLLFQWANSLCQGANLPLPVPLKVDKVQGGARLGFISVEDGKTSVLVYIDCLVFPANNLAGPLFRAIRNGPLKDKAAPGEPRIMRSLLQALQKSSEIAKI
ncbi:uncharacterized protein A4U43_C04F7070 [Asparagus officinalis]|uniref:DUF7148 domain-containing protein n=1 Tax=Asparagus officinalis TaxID=4686 RepID=A0A5P1EZC4_ASPOF|nr:uncharacterized protein LOC109836788 [Asparagus officinalis]ONK71302.1 uncharacterized protein A4U43_C04F7070 [Asparagus officinalis]